MTTTELFVVDRDYVVGPRRVKVRRIAEGIRALQDGVHHRWNPGNFRYRHLTLTMTEFHDLQRRLPEQGLAVDVLHHVDDVFDLPSSANPTLDRIAVGMGLDNSLSPRQQARKFFSDRRLIFNAQQELRFDHLTRDDKAAFARVDNFQSRTLPHLPVARRVRFVRVGLELAETQEERTEIATGPLEDAVLSIVNQTELDDVAREFSLSPNLRAICRDAIDISRADWDAEIAERWKSIVS